MCVDIHTRTQSFFFMKTSTDEQTYYSSACKSHGLEAPELKQPPQGLRGMAGRGHSVELLFSL